MALFSKLYKSLKGNTKVSHMHVESQSTNITIVNSLTVKFYYNYIIVILIKPFKHCL